MKEENKRHYKSVFENEQELLNAIIDLHLNEKNIELDPMYFKGNFYKNGVKQPKYKFDINPQSENVKKANAKALPILSGEVDSIILDPPFIITSTEFTYPSKTHGFFKSFVELEELYISIIKEAYRCLKKNGVLIFKCQDHTDTKTIFTHCIVKEIAECAGFYTKDLAILVKKNKITNPTLKQKHLRKVHTYFWVFIKKIN